MEEFYTKDGTITFVVPFLFTKEELNSRNKCTKVFKKISPCYSEKDYEKIKDSLKESLKRIFPKIQNSYPGISIIGKEHKYGRRCNYCVINATKDDYEGRNLCHCFSISRKFHDDRSKNIPRIELFLGTYKVCYELQDPDNTFVFYIDLSLLLSNEDGVECGYLVFNISLESIIDNLIIPNGGNSLDRIIFLKHLFYKNSLKCCFDDGKSRISIQDWAENILYSILKEFGIKKYNKSIGNYVISDKKNNVTGAAFRYSIVELYNIVDSSNNLIPVSDIDYLLRKYENQLYGLLVSDEGWRFMPFNSSNYKLSKSYWASRSFITSFFLGHNALFINQYSQADNIRFPEAAKKWYDNYKQTDEHDYYSKYVGLRPCVPGIASLTFFSFLNAIAKELKIEKVKSSTMSPAMSDEEKYKKMAFALQKHSMSLDEIKNIDDCIYAQFGIPAELKDIHESYLREANNVQNNKVKYLTHVSAMISIAACFIAMLAISTYGGSMYLSHLCTSRTLLIVALVVPLFVYFVYCVTPLDKIKKLFKSKFKKIKWYIIFL